MITILGAGNMGTALAEIIARQGHRVFLWDYNPDTVRAIKKTGKNQKFLPDIKLSRRIIPQENMSAAADAEIIIIACSSPFVRVTARRLAGYLKNNRTIVAHVAKGIEEKTFFTMHEVIQSELAPEFRPKVTTISGPSNANEFVRGIPTAVAAAGENRRARERICRILSSPNFRVFPSADIKGVSICGALKNVYAIALGMCDGMNFGGLHWDSVMNAKAFMLTTALKEMENFVRVFGGRKETIWGMAGVGDLIVTGLGRGRNRALGERICRAGTCRFLLYEQGAQTLEGVAAAKTLNAFADKKRIKAPLLRIVHRVLRGGADPSREIKKYFLESIL
jgi:glycerol-3-phosphate dehydrogenase (NAD(P)+)